MKNLLSLLFPVIIFAGCSAPADRNDNPDKGSVVHTGNATDTFPVSDTGKSTVLNAADSARMVFNDDSSVSGTPSGRGTERKGEAVGTGSSRPGENYPNPNHPNDSSGRK